MMSVLTLFLFFLVLLLLNRIDKSTKSTAFEMKAICKELETIKFHVEKNCLCQKEKKVTQMMAVNALTSPMQQKSF